MLLPVHIQHLQVCAFGAFNACLSFPESLNVFIDKCVIAFEKSVSLYGISKSGNFRTKIIKVQLHNKVDKMLPVVVALHCIVHWIKNFF